MSGRQDKQPQSLCRLGYARPTARPPARRVRTTLTGAPQTRKLLLDAFRLIDVDNDRRLTYDEMCDALGAHSVEQSRRKSAPGPGSSGLLGLYLAREDIIRLCAVGRVALSTRRADVCLTCGVLQMADVNGDGVITCDEFVAALATESDSPPASHVDPFWRVRRAQDTAPQCAHLCPT